VAGPAVIQGRYPQLWQLLGGYFHQDWDLAGPDWRAVVATYRAESDPQDPARAAREIGTLLNATEDDGELERIVYDDFGCDFYLPGAGLTVREWLAAVRRTLE
jgi:hypothetical protein